MNMLQAAGGPGPDRVIAVSGATGFVGRRLCALLVSRGGRVRALTRGATPEPGAEAVPVRDLEDSVALGDAVRGVDTVVHLASRVHVMRETDADPTAAFRRVNVDGTINLARQAAAAGVRRFVFLSSVKVNGEAGRFRESDTPAPRDAYGISKRDAEAGLREVAEAASMEVVIIRPPLVYGPGVRANFAALTRAVARGIPLPLGAVNNRRSLVAIDNLVDLITTCLEHPAAANETFFVSDDQDLSTPELVRRLARAMGRPARLFPVPAALLLAGATLLGKRDAVQRLLGSLQVDITKAHTLLGWTPPVSVDEGLRRSVRSLS